MIQFAAIVTGIFREAIAKKIFLGFMVISTLIILAFVFIVNLDSVDGMIAMFGASGDTAVKDMVIGFQILVLNFSYLLIITFCLISVSSFIPSMVEKREYRRTAFKTYFKGSNYNRKVYRWGITNLCEFAVSDWICMVDFIS